MEKRIGASEARRKFGKVMQEIAAGDIFIVERRGKSAAVMMPFEVYRQHKREEFFDMIKAAAERANMSEEEADKLAEEAVRAVRAEDRKSVRGAGGGDEG